MPQSLFLKSEFFQFRVSLHQIAHDDCHFHNELPVLIFLCTGLRFFRYIKVIALILFAVFFSPSHCLGILFLIIDSFGHTTNNLCQINRFITHAQIFLEKVRVYNRTGNTHRNTAHRQIRFATHCGYSLSRTCKTQNFFSYICRNRIVIQVLYIATINAKCRKSFLCMSCQHSSQIYSSRTLCSIKSPNSFRIIRIHIHCFGTVTPA